MSDDPSPLPESSSPSDCWSLLLRIMTILLSEDEDEQDEHDEDPEEEEEEEEKPDCPSSSSSSTSSWVIMSLVCTASSSPMMPRPSSIPSCPSSSSSSSSKYGISKTWKDDRIVKGSVGR